MTTTRNPEGHEKRRLRDVFGNLRRVDEVLGAVTYTTSYEYNAAADLTQVTDAQANVTAIALDTAGRKRQLTDPDTGVTTYGYDGNGNLVLRTTAAGAITEAWDYDELDRPVARRLDGSTTPESQWIYGSAGSAAANGVDLLQRRIDGAGVYEVTAYDKAGRALEEKQTPPEGASAAQVFRTGYDWLGQVVTREYPNAVTVRWNRDLRGYLTGVARQGGETGQAPSPRQ